VARAVRADPPSIVLFRHLDHAMGAGTPKKQRVAEATDLGRYAGLGFQFAATMLVFGALGWWLDARLGSSPWLLIAGIFLGATGAFIGLLRAVGGVEAKPRAARAEDEARAASAEDSEEQGPR
jgi:F0F1-type ATP synthase assembly protein I